MSTLNPGDFEKNKIIIKTIKFHSNFYEKIKIRMKELNTKNFSGYVKKLIKKDLS